MNHGSIIEKEFPAEFAGERVGWLILDRLEERYLSVYIVTATVGEGGAVAKRIAGTNLRSSDNVEGFHDVSGLHLFVEEIDDGPKTVHPLELKCDNTFKHPSPGYIINEWPQIEGLEARSWFSGRQQLLDVIKQGLVDLGHTESYPNIYYYLNGHMGHPARNSDSIYPPDQALVLPYQDRFFPDPAMQEQTAQQIEIAEAAAKALEDEVEVDQAMLGRLTVFSELTPEEVPDSFEESRLAVASLERIAQRGLNSPFSNFLYLPVGFRPAGRSWPYMDPTEGNPDKAYGRELAALRTRDVEPARIELKRELKELKYRSAYASHGLVTLRILSLAEKSASKSTAASSL